MAKRVVVGALAGAYGVQGDVRLKSFCATPEDIATYVPIEREDGSEIASLVLKGATNGALIARIDGISTKEEADAAKGQKLYVPREALPKPDEDEYYYSDLIGMDAFDTGGAKLGKVKAVHNHGATDLLELLRATGSASVFVPFTRDVVPTVDIDARRIVIDPPEGLLD